MTQFSNICGAPPIKNQIIFLGGNDSHFDDHTLRKLKFRNIQHFLLKAGVSINDQPNDNVPNTKLKSLYSEVKAKWRAKYGTTIFLPRHMNSILVEAWDAFKVSDGNITRDIFVRKKLPPFSPPDLKTNTQARTASIQVFSGAKAE